MKNELGGREESNYQDNNSVKTVILLLRSLIQSLKQTKISRLCRSNKGLLGGSGAYDEDRLKRKLQKQGFDLLSSFVFIERDLAWR